jgi:light-regulated signal transduction histidine kinase (bacteriophytochrome)
MKMGDFNQDRAAAEVERLRQALEAETEHCVNVQRRFDRANAEFEEFVSTAAHNMRESLRGVTSYSQLLAETCAGRLDANAIAYLDHIQADAARIQALLTDVVDYWTTGAGELQPTRTDMDAVLDQALLFKDTLIAERGAIVTHDPLPVVSGNFAILTKVLRHLIKNAIQYCGASAPRVHVSATRVNADWEFSVADNGPGIDPAFHERIFGAFKRLHGKEYPGHGLGLAFCKRAIEWHGGRIWVESAPGAGARFCFTLPAAE